MFVASGLLQTFHFDPAPLHLKLLLTQYDIDSPATLEFTDQAVPVKLTGKGIHLALTGFTGTCSELDFDGSGNPIGCPGAAGALSLGGTAYPGVTDGTLSFDSLGNITAIDRAYGISIPSGSFVGSCGSASASVGTTFACVGAAGTWNAFTIPLTIANAVVDINVTTGAMTIEDGFTVHLDDGNFYGDLGSAAISGNTLNGAGTMAGTVGGIKFSGGDLPENGLYPIVASMDWVDKKFSFSTQDAMEFGTQVNTPNFEDICDAFTLNETDGLKCQGPAGAETLGADGKFHVIDGYAFETDITGTQVHNCGGISITNCH